MKPLIIFSGILLNLFFLSCGSSIILNGADIVHWKKYEPPTINIPVQELQMAVIDSFIVPCNSSADQFYSRSSQFLESNGFEIEKQDFERTGLIANQRSNGGKLQIIVRYPAKVFHSSVILDTAYVLFYGAQTSALDTRQQSLLATLKDGFYQQCPALATRGIMGIAPASSQTESEKLIVEKFGRKALAAINLIDGKRTMHEIAQAVNMNDEEAKDLFGFMMEKGFIGK